MKLNLGCGNDVREGYTNVDFRPLSPLVQRVDLSVFPWPWENESVEEVMMLDFLEHFPRAKTSVILSESYRMLQGGGRVVIQVPDMTILSGAIIGIPSIQCNVCGGHFGGGRVCSRCHTSRKELVDSAFGRMYGGQDYDGNFHLAGFTKLSMIGLLGSHGFTSVLFEEEEHQAANWNFKVTARRPL